jgi:RNA polymerase primary sigma factor
MAQTANSGGAAVANLDRYLDELSQIPLLAREEEIELGRALRVYDRLWRRRALACAAIARAIHERWVQEQQMGRRPTTLSEGYSDAGAAARLPMVEAAMHEVGALVDQRAALMASGERDGRELTRLRLRTRMALDRSMLRADVVERAQDEIGDTLRRAARREKMPLGDLRRELAAATELHQQWLSIRSRFAQANLRLVVHIGKGFRQSDLPFEDVIQEGNTGLLRAVEKFDYRRGVRFSSYAGFWIKQAILRAQRYRGKLIRLPACAEERLPKLRELRRRSELLRGRDLDAAEITATLGLEPDVEAEVVRALQSPASIDTPVSEDESLTLGATLEDTEAESPVDHALAIQLHDELQQILRRLSKRERRVVHRRFGTDGQPPETLEEIGRELGISRERVRQIERDALDQMRHAAKSRSLDTLLH